MDVKKQYLKIIHQPITTYLKLIFSITLYLCHKFNSSIALPNLSVRSPRQTAFKAK